MCYSGTWFLGLVCRFFCCYLALLALCIPGPNMTHRFVVLVAQFCVLKQIIFMCIVDAKDFLDAKDGVRGSCREDDARRWWPNVSQHGPDEHVWSKKDDTSIPRPSPPSRGLATTGTTGTSDGTHELPARRSNKLWRSSRYSSSLRFSVMLSTCK